VLKSIEEQGKLTPELRAAIEAAPTKQELEDLYLPYKPRRRTKGQIAREAGIEPLADLLWADPSATPPPKPGLRQEGKGRGRRRLHHRAGRAGRRARHPVRALGRRRRAGAVLREWLWTEGLLKSKLAAGKDENNPDVAKFRDYFDYDEPIGRVPSHRALAVFRGRALDILEAKLVLPVEPEPGQPSIAEGKIALHLGWSHQAPQGRRPAAQVRGLDLAREAVAVHRARPVLAPARRRREGRHQGVRREPARPAAGGAGRPARGDGPGPRHPHRRQGGGGRCHRQAGRHGHGLPARAARDWEGSLHTLAQLCRKHGVNLIAIGNGTASRETDKLAADLMKRLEGEIQRVVVSEAGASVYSASEYASQEMPTWTSACAARPASRAACRTRWRNW
jgi:uncharacterized protein